MNLFLSRILMPLAVIAAAALAAVVVLDRLSLDRQADERRAIYDREAALTRQALTPGSSIACLAGVASETVESACERAVFASPERTAAATAFVAAQWRLLKDAAAVARGNAAMLADFATTRRALELDRFGLAAQVLSQRDGCTADRCDAFTLVSDAEVLKSNLRSQVFDQYVARHAPGWTAPRAVPDATVSQSPAPPEPPALATAPPSPPEQVAHPLSDKYDFPSAASIPPVSIMNTEPARPKDDVAAGAAAAADNPPIPPKRPQAEATPPAPAR